MNEWVVFVNSIMTKINHYDFVSYTINFIKGAAIILVVVQLITKYLKARDGGEIFKPKDIIRPLVLCAILGSYNYFMDGAESLMAAGDTYLNENITESGDIKASLIESKTNVKDSIPDQYDGMKLDADQYPEDYIASGISQITQLIKNPSSIIIKIFQLIGDFLGTLVYVAALLIRAFVLFALKLLGPIAVVLSIYEKVHNAMWNWLRQYLVYFLWLIPMYISVTFMDVVQNECYLGHVPGGYSISTVVSLVGFVVKLVIMKSSLDLLKSIIVNAGKEEN